MIDKHLVKSESEFLDLFKDWELEDVEEVVGLEFAFKDGRFQTDLCYEDVDFDEEQDIDRQNYRKYEENNFPESYPAIVLLQNDDDFDRMGRIRHQTLLLVYPSDFESR